MSNKTSFLVLIGLLVLIGCIAVPVSADVPPTSNFTFPDLYGGNVYCGPIPANISLQDESTGGPTSCFWDFGDGTSMLGQSTNSTVKSAKHTFSTNGTYNVTLVEMSDTGEIGVAPAVIVNVQYANPSIIQWIIDAITHILPIS